MNITELKSGKQVNNLPHVSLALGNFDGVHMGHRAVITACIGYARETGMKSAVWCFAQNPKPNVDGLLTDTEEKMRIFTELGADYVILENFENVKDMSPQAFVKEYLKKLGAKAVFSGFNFRFGKGASGDVPLLERLCGEEGIFFGCTDRVSENGAVLSSSLIRSLIKEGRVDEAEKLLLRPYSITSEVTHGRHLGASLGFPTVNQSFDNGKTVPKNAVYLTLTIIDEKAYPSVSNVGARPTVNGKHLRLETHILDFEGDLYGKKITVEFKKFRRDETKFSSEEQLKNAVLADIAAAKEYFSKKEDIR